MKYDFYQFQPRHEYDCSLQFWKWLRGNYSQNDIPKIGDSLNLRYAAIHLEVIEINLPYEKVKIRCDGYYPDLVKHGQ